MAARQRAGAPPLRAVLLALSSATEPRPCSFLPCPSPWNGTRPYSSHGASHQVLRPEPPPSSTSISTANEEACRQQASETSKEQRRERRRELLEAAKHEPEWRILVMGRKGATPTLESAPAPPLPTTAASPGGEVATLNDKERKKEDFTRRVMRRRLRRITHGASRDPRLPENLWAAMGFYEVRFVRSTRSVAEVQNAVNAWYSSLSFRPNFKAELDMVKASHMEGCRYADFFSHPKGRARIGRRFSAKYGEKTEGVLTTAFPVLLCAEDTSPEQKQFLSQLGEFKWHEVWGGDRVVSLSTGTRNITQKLDDCLQPTDKVMDVGLQPQAVWKREGRKRLGEVEEELSKQAIIEAEEARGILKPKEGKETWEVELHSVARTDQEREQGMGKASLVLVPMYRLHYRWRGYDYHLCVRDGDDPLRGPPVVEGSRPYSYAKISLAGMAGLSVAFASSWLITH